MKMCLTDPAKIRAGLLKKNGWLTIGEVAKGLNINARTVARAFRREGIKPHTARIFADALDLNVTDIVTFK